jgi:hypothetical protein
LARLTAGGDTKVVLQEPKTLSGKPASVDLVLVKTHLSPLVFAGRMTAAPFTPALDRVEGRLERCRATAVTSLSRWAEVAVPGSSTRRILRMIAELRPPP